MPLFPGCDGKPWQTEAQLEAERVFRAAELVLKNAFDERFWCGLPKKRHVHQAYSLLTILAARELQEHNHPMGWVHSYRFTLLKYLVSVARLVVDDVDHRADYRWHDPTDPGCCRGNCPKVSDEFHPEAMAQRMERWERELERQISLREVLEK